MCWGLGHSTQMCRAMGWAGLGRAGICAVQTSGPGAPGLEGTGCAPWSPHLVPVPEKLG